jgi:hypothetical protein
VAIPQTAAAALPNPSILKPNTSKLTGFTEMASPLEIWEATEEIKLPSPLPDVVELVDPEVVAVEVPDGIYVEAAIPVGVGCPTCSKKSNLR